MSLRPDPPRQPHRVIAAAGADIGHVEIGFTPSSRMTRPASPARSRDCSSLHVSVTIPATFRLGAGNAPAGTPGGASPST
jgi:hypothetical protein